MSNNKSAEDKKKSKFNLPNFMSHGSLKRVAPRSLDELHKPVFLQFHAALLSGKPPD